MEGFSAAEVEMNDFESIAESVRPLVSPVSVWVRLPVSVGRLVGGAVDV